MNSKANFKLEINASQENTWKTLVDPNLVEKYMFGTRPESGWTPGGEIKWNMLKDGINVTYVNGNIIDLKKPEFLSYTVFPTNSNLRDEQDNYLKVEHQIKKLEDKKSLLIITVSDFTKVEDGEKRYNDTINGWNSVLPKIKELAENL